MNGIAIVGAGLLGLLVGPLLRRAVDRVPGRQPLFGGDGALVGVASFTPVLSWFEPQPFGTTSYLVGPDDRTVDDPGPTATTRWRAPLIDLSAAVVMGSFAHRFGWGWDLPAYLVFAASMVVVSAIDIDHFRIPDRVVYPTLGACSALLAGAAAVAGAPGGLIGAAAGALAYCGFLFVFFFVYPQGMGFGDVKLALVLGLHAGWAGSVASVGGELVYAGWSFGMRLVLVAALFGSMIGAVVGLGSLVVLKRKGAFPFGPALCVGALLAILFSEQLLN